MSTIPKAAYFRLINFICFRLKGLLIFRGLVQKWKLSRNVDGALSFPFIARRRTSNFQILTYHRVCDQSGPYLPATPVEVFQRHMEILSTYCHVCDLLEAVELAKGRDLPENTVVITFDDGYRDNYVHAFPILDQLSLPATVFVATGVIGTGKLLWHDQVISMIHKTSKPSLQWNEFEENVFPLRTDQEKAVAVPKILWELRGANDEKRDQMVRELEKKLDIVNGEKQFDLMLSWEEIQIMFQRGISFGSHTVTHPILSQASLDKGREEIRESKRTLQNRLGVPVTTFAYPSGRRVDFTDATKKILKEEGYSCAVSMMWGVNDRHRDCYELRRIALSDQESWRFGLRQLFYKFTF